MAESIPKGYPQDIPGDLTNQSQRGGVREGCRERIPKGISEEKYGKPVSQLLKRAPQYALPASLAQAPNMIY